MRLREFAIGFPDAVEDFPWGERAIKVRKKVFLFMRLNGQQLSFTVKLPESNDFARQFPFAASTGYGLGKSGWITCTFLKPKDLPDEALLRDWIRESYHAVAPKKLSALLDSAPTRSVAASATGVAALGRHRAARKKK